MEDEEDYTGFDCDAGGCGDVVFGDDPLFAMPPGEAADGGSFTEEAETSPSEDPDDGDIGDDMDRDDSESLSLDDERYSGVLKLLDEQLNSPIRPHSEAPTVNLPHPTTAKEWGIHVLVWLARTVFNPSVANAPREEDTKTYAQQTNGELAVGAIPPIGPKNGLGTPKSNPVGTAPLWSSTKLRTGVQNAFEHFKKHGAEFPGIQNAKQYIEAAANFVKSPPIGTLSKVRNNGDVVLYHPGSNTFGVANSSGVPKTMFKPDPAKHGYPTNLDYFNAQ